MELWKEVKGYEGYYEVSSIGRVRSVDRYVNTGIRHSEKKLVKGSLLKLSLKRNGYLAVDLRKGSKQKTVSVHRLVAIAFIPQVEGKPIVNHKNLIKTDNRVENLEWVTRSENVQHAVDNGALPGNGLKKRIRCVETGEEFESSYQAADWLNRTKYQYTKNISHMAQNIRACCLGMRHMTHGYHWEDVV